MININNNIVLCYLLILPTIYHYLLLRAIICYYMALLVTICHYHKYNEHAHTPRGASLHIRGSKRTLKWPSAGRDSFSSNCLQATYAQTYAQQPNMNSILEALGRVSLNMFAHVGDILSDKSQLFSTISKQQTNIILTTPNFNHSLLSPCGPG
jgi:hypothetical protein